MLTAKYQLLPESLQKLFKMRERRFDLRGIYMFKKHLVRTDVKNICISVKGVNWWKICSEKLKTCRRLMYVCVYMNLYIWPICFCYWLLTADVDIEARDDQCGCGCGSECTDVAGVCVWWLWGGLFLFLCFELWSNDTFQYVGQKGKKVRNG